MNPIHRFALLFVLQLCAYSVLLPLVTDRHPAIIRVITLLTAWVDFQILSLFTDRVTMTRNVLTFDRFSVEVVLECVGIMEMVILSASILAFPTSWGKRAIGLLIGLPMIYAFNLLRIIVLLLAGRFYPAVFDFLHVYFWQGTLIVMITLVWLFWVFKIVGNDGGLPRDEDGTAVRA